MLLIEGKDEGGYPRMLTVQRPNAKNTSTTLRLYEPDGKGGWSGKLLGSIVLGHADTAELALNLS